MSKSLPIYEGIVLSHDKKKNANYAPMGFSLISKNKVELHVFNSSRTYKNILASNGFTLLFPTDTYEFFNALKNNKINGKNISGSWKIKTELIKQNEKAAHITGTIVTQKGKPFFFSRAPHLLLEALIKCTRIGKINVSTDKKLKVELLEIKRVIGKVAPGSKYEKAMRKIP